SAIVQSRYSFPSASTTRQPIAWVKCVGPTASAAPYNASVRLLPVDAPVGITARARAAQSGSSCSSTLSSGDSVSASAPSSAAAAGASGAAGSVLRAVALAARSKERGTGMWGRSPAAPASLFVASSNGRRAFHVVQHL